MIEPSILIGIGTLALGGVIWGVRLEGKVTAHEQLFEEREKQLEERHEDLKSRLARIELKLDRNNFLERKA